MKQKGIIVESNSEWSSTMVIVPKKAGGAPIINQHTKFDPYAKDRQATRYDWSSSLLPGAHEGGGPNQNCICVTLSIYSNALQPMWSSHHLPVFDGHCVVRNWTLLAQTNLGKTSCEQPHQRILRCYLTESPERNGECRRWNNLSMHYWISDASDGECSGRT